MVRTTLVAEDTQNDTVRWRHRQTQKRGSPANISPATPTTVFAVFLGPETEARKGRTWVVGRIWRCMMGSCICPLETPARLLWTTSFFRH